MLALSRFDIAWIVALRRAVSFPAATLGLGGSSGGFTVSLSASDPSTQSFSRFMNRVKYFKNRALLASIRSPRSDSSGCRGRPRSSAATASMQA
uniref:Putative secreted peptide n=1 Tax=Anopheles braziliensis TaxID=58242 RepID=A0A2M3ZUZ8_9DIPT